MSGHSCHALLDADRAYLLDIGDPEQHLLDAVLLRRAHTLVQAGREHLGNPRVILDVLLDPVRADQQLVQAKPALVAGIAARVAALRGMEHDLALLVAELLRPLLAQLRLLFLADRPAPLLGFARNPLRFTALPVALRSPRPRINTFCAI